MTTCPANMSGRNNHEWTDVDDAADTQRHSFGLITNSIQITLQEAGVYHHASVEASQVFLFLGG